MEKLSSMISELHEVDRSAKNYASQFESKLSEIIDLRSPEIVVPLLELLDDEAPYDEVMFSIIHGIEIFDDTTYVHEILRGAKDLCWRAPRWASILFMRILNTDSSRHELVRQVRDTDIETKKAVKELMEKINARSVQFMAKTTPVIVATSKKEPR